MSSIHLVPYDPTWPTAFANIKTELSAALDGVAVLSIEHVGSTSVPGLPAKPVIDVDVVVEENTVRDAIRALERVGYRYEGMKGVADRHAFRSSEGVSPKRSVYVVIDDSLALRNHLALRNVLSRDDVLRKRYATIKRRLAEKLSDPDRYTAGKSEIIEAILEQGGLSKSEQVSTRLANQAVVAQRPDEHTVVTDDGARLWVEESGPPEGAAVVLCHGGPGTADYLKDLRDILTDVGMRVVRWDQRGSGRSDGKGPYSVEWFVADLAAVRRTVVGEACWLVGHSWGANLALASAQLHSYELEGVVYMCGTGLEWWPGNSARHKERQRERLGRALGARLEDLRNRARTPQEEDEYQLLYLRSELADTDDIGLARRLLETDRRFPINYEVNTAISSEMKRWDLQRQKSRCLAVTVPVLVVDGQLDPRPAEALDSLMAFLPDATRAQMEGAGHWPWLEQPERTRQLLSEFLPATGPSKAQR